MGPDLSFGTSREDTSLGVRRAYERAFQAGEILFDVDDPATVLYVIQSGTVELVRPGPDRPRIVARLGAGDLFGEMGVLTGSRRTLRAVAASEARVLELDRSTFQSMCRERPEISLGIIERLATRVIELEKRLVGSGVDDLLRPLVRSLLRHAERGEASARIRVSLRALAADAGLSILDAHRTLQGLFERKLLRLVDDVLIVPDLDALAASLDLAEGPA